MSKMVYLPYVRFEQKEGEAEGIGWYLMPKQEKVEAGMEQSSCRTVSLKRNARAANRKQSSLM